MKKSLVALVASSLFLFACSDSGSDSTDIADLCRTAPKLTKRCLDGSWKSVRFEASDGETIDDATLFYTGGVLKLSVNDSKNNTTREEFAYSSQRLATRGYWQIAADSAKFQSIECGSGDCISSLLSNISAELIAVDTLAITSSKAVFEGVAGVAKEIFVRQ